MKPLDLFIILVLLLAFIVVMALMPMPKVEAAPIQLSHGVLYQPGTENYEIWSLTQ
jgi:hypothetical protein